MSVTKRQRNEHLDEIKSLPQTLIFYEAPHKLRMTLQDLYDALGDRRISLCRELTKVHEEVIRGKISDMIALYETQAPRGEYVLVVEGADEQKVNKAYPRSGSRNGSSARFRRKKGVGGV